MTVPLTDLRLAVSFFAHQRDNEPKLRTLSWADLAARLTPEHPSVAAKDRRPAWSPATYPPGVRRSNANVLSVSLLVADVDDGTDPERVLDLFDGHARLVHTSWSHQREKRGAVVARCRLVVPLAEPVPAEQWSRVWRGAELAAGRVGITIDPAVDSPSEIYFLPCLRDEDQPWWFAVRAGEPLNWRSLPEPLPLLSSPPPEASRTSERPVPGPGVVDLFYTRSGSEGANAEARIAGMVRVECEKIARAESRHQALLAAARYVGGLCTRYGVDPSPFGSSLIAAAGDSNDAARTCRDGFAYGAQAPIELPPDRPVPGFAANRKDATVPDLDPAVDQEGDPGAAEEEPAPEWLARLRTAVEAGDPESLFADREVLIGITRPSVWSGVVEQLLQRLPHANRTALRRAGRNLSAANRTQQRAQQIAELPIVVEHGQTWWVLEGDRYLSVDRSLAAIEVARIHKIDTTVTTESGARYMTAQELYGAHGVTARKVRWTYDATGPAWDPEERVLDIPGARVRQGRAERSDLVEGWIYSLVLESQVDTLLDWLATCVRLDRPTASPQFRGPDSAGKAMLVAALATLLGGRTDYTHATDNFNAGLVYGPLVVLDEGVAESNPDAFRRLTGNREHDVTAKNRMPEELRGCPRVVVTSNEPDPLQLGREELSSQSENALGRRILVFDVQVAAVDYLADLGGWDATADWAAPDGELVAHLRWLAEDRGPKVTPGRRFLVEGDASAWVATAHLRAGVAGDIVQAFLAYDDLVQEGRTGTLKEPHPFVFYDANHDLVGVNPGGLQANWSVLVDQKIPSNQRIVKALRRLSGQEVPVRPVLRPGVQGPRVYLVPGAKLRGGSA